MNSYFYKHQKSLIEHSVTHTDTNTQDKKVDADRSLRSASISVQIKALRDRDTPDFPQKCRFCSERFPTYDHYMAHMTIEHQIKSMMIDWNGTNYGSKNIFESSKPPEAAFDVPSVSNLLKEWYKMQPVRIPAFFKCLFCGVRQYPERNSVSFALQRKLTNKDAFEKIWNHTYDCFQRTLKMDAFRFECIWCKQKLLASPVNFEAHSSQARLVNLFIFYNYLLNDFYY